MERNISIGINFEALFEYATEGILVADEKGLIIRVNPALERLFGYAPGELVQQPVEVLVPQSYARRHEAHRKHFNEAPHPRQMGIGLDLHGQKKDGTAFPVEVSLSPFYSGASKFVIAFIVDNTIRKQYENAILQQKKDLEDLTIALRASNEDLENFAYVSSHDLQEPLRKIRSFSDILLTMERERLTEEGIDYLERIQSAAARMQALIQDLLAFSRLTSRARKFERVDLNEILQEVLSDLEVIIMQTGAHLHIGPLPVIEADPTQMRQLFQNLLSNALKFRREDMAPEVHVRQMPPPASGFVEIVVEDNGIGFDEKYLEKIFTIFQRLEGKKYEGTGIGLAICRKIAQRHGGHVTARSKAGEGAAFSVTLATSASLPKPPENTGFDYGTD